LAVCDFVRTVKIREFTADQIIAPSLRADFDGISPSTLRQLRKKQDETARSLEKIERGELPGSLGHVAELTVVCYAIRLRLVEFADRPDILKAMAQRALEDAGRDDAPAREE
jgi:hypothetical protein